jgi:ribosome-associated protein
MPPFSLHGQHITLAQALKAVGLAGSGGQAKHLVRSGSVLVNGAVEVQPGRKLVSGDRFGTSGGEEWVISPGDGQNGPDQAIGKRG